MESIEEVATMAMIKEIALTVVLGLLTLAAFSTGAELVAVLR